MRGRRPCLRGRGPRGRGPGQVPQPPSGGPLAGGVDGAAPRARTARGARAHMGADHTRAPAARAGSIPPSCSPAPWRGGCASPPSACWAPPGPPQTGLPARAGRAARGSTPERSVPALVVVVRRHRHHGRHAHRPRAARCVRPARSAWSRSPRRGRRHPVTRAEAHATSTDVAIDLRILASRLRHPSEVLMDVVVRGKNRPVPAGSKALAQEKVVAHRPLHPRRRSGRGRLLRDPHRRVAESAAVRDHGAPQAPLREGARVRRRAGGRARPGDRQGGAPGRADQGEARRAHASGAATGPPPTATAIAARR